MLFDIISDAHADKLGVDKMVDLLPRMSKTLIIAGDICSHYSSTNWTIMTAFLSVCCSFYDRVIYVIGNHELYVHTQIEKSDFQSIWSSITDLMKILKNLYVLNNQCMILGEEKLVIFGATMFSNAIESSFPTNLPIKVSL